MQQAVPIQRLVMVKYECAYEGCTRNDALIMYSAPFDSQIGLFACELCSTANKGHIPVALRCEQRNALFPLQDEDRQTLRIMRSNHTLEDDWAPISMRDWKIAFNSVRSAPIALSETGDVLIMMMKQCKPALYRHHSLIQLIGLNPQWKPMLRLHKDIHLCAEAKAMWRRKWLQCNLPVEAEP